MNTTNPEKTTDAIARPGPSGLEQESTSGNLKYSLKVSTYINIHKILVLPVVVGLMWYYGNWSTDAYIYLAMHGTYSILWLLKHAMYADRRFAKNLPLWIGVPFLFLPLAGYYIAPYLLISSRVSVPPPTFRSKVLARMPRVSRINCRSYEARGHMETFQAKRRQNLRAAIFRARSAVTTNHRV